MKVILNEPYYKIWFLELQGMFVEAISKICEQKKEIEELRRVIAAKSALRLVKGGIDAKKTGKEKGPP